AGSRAPRAHHAARQGRVRSARHPQPRPALRRPVVDHAMVPNTLILIILLVASGFSYMAYFLDIPKRPIMNRKFLMMGGGAALMIFTVVLAVIDVRIVWLSWVLLAM